MIKCLHIFSAKEKKKKRAYHNSETILKNTRKPENIQESCRLFDVR